MAEIKCKRIIDGKTYNTETAACIESWKNDLGHEISGERLYQNRFGAFFLFSYAYSGSQDTKEMITPLIPDQAQTWLEEHRSSRTDLIESLFGNMPEAGSGESKFTLRMPDSLRDRLAERAKASKQSLNAWIVRCLESCAADTDTETAKDIPPMGNMVGSNATGWRTKGT